MHEQSTKKRRIGARRNGKKKIGALSGRGPARVDNNDLRSTLTLVFGHALKEHRMAPRRIRADENEKIGLIKILVDPRHRIGAEGTAVAGNRRCHAQARVGVDIGRPDEALHQFVGDVVVLGEKLSGEIKGNGVGPIARNDVLEAIRHLVKRCRPVGSCQPAVRLANHRMQQAPIQSERFTKRKALRA